MRMRRYHIELTAALIVYGVLLVISIVSAKRLHLQGGALTAVMLLPMIGAVLALWAIVRGHRRLDELEQRIQFEALSFAFAGTALLTFGWGFVELAGHPRFPTFGIWPLMAALWLVGQAIARRRYR